MKINKESNKYTIIYASILVIVVAVGLAFTSQVLKDRQKKNEDIDKMRQILRAVNIQSTNKDADKKYAEYIVSSFVIDASGKKVSDEGFAVDMIKETRNMKKGKPFKLPVFIAEIEGKTYYIMALRGAGLWGPIWGYVSVGEDKNTVYGVDLSHQGETPTLGAEISTPEFCAQFIGKKLFIDGVFRPIAVVKPGESLAGQDFVDGITGGTKTSVGVHDMFFDSLKGYETFLKTVNGK